jgi:hypothetical protein
MSTITTSTITRHTARFASMALILSVLATACAVDATPGNGAPQEGSAAGEHTGEAKQEITEQGAGAAEESIGGGVQQGPIGLCGGLSLCGLSCVDLKTDNNNCGSCGTICHPFWVRHTFIDIHCVEGNCL